MARGIGASLALAALVVGLAAGGCSTRTAAIVVDHPVSLADTALRIQVTGVDAGERVEVAAQAVDYKDTTWRSAATFVADQNGSVDLGGVAPVDGSYTGVDPMGLFWSMDQASGSDDTASFYPHFPDGYDVQLTATPEHSGATRAQVHRVWMTPGVTHRALTLADDQVVGELYEPATPAGRGVLLLGGSEGGISTAYTAALLASHGSPGRPAARSCSTPTRGMASGAWCTCRPARMSYTR